MENFHLSVSNPDLLPLVHECLIKWKLLCRSEVWPQCLNSQDILSLYNFDLNLHYVYCTVLNKLGIGRSKMYIYTVCWDHFQKSQSSWQCISEAAGWFNVLRDDGSQGSIRFVADETEGVVQDVVREWHDDVLLNFSSLKSATEDKDWVLPMEFEDSSLAPTSTPWFSRAPSSESSNQGSAGLIG